MKETATQLLSVEQEDQAAVLTVLTRQVDSSVLARIEREATLMAARGQKRPLVLRMDGVEVISSVMMGTLLNLLRKLKQRGLRLILVGLNENIHGTFRLTNLDQMFEIFDSLDQVQEVMRKHSR